ncbi:MAG: hypothetical protein E7596_00570 [Ruminococcaceae bacterium]|nr:hypothetical protein [Oscillospiraceae bacterium]
MSTINNAMLKSCLIESTLAEIKEIETLDYSDITVSESFKERIRKTITSQQPVRHTFNPKRVVVAIVAAILVSICVMFTVSAEIRNAVADFFVKAYETFTQLIIVENNEGDKDVTNTTPTQPEVVYPTSIETEYTLSYIADNNYIELDKIVNDGRVFTVWTDNTCIIDLTQSIVDENDILLDNETSLMQSKLIGDKEIFYSLKNGVYFVSWLEHGYYFSLSCDEALGWAEIEKIVLSLNEINK